MTDRKKPDGDSKKTEDKRKAALKVDTLEQRILLSATWVDADTGDAIPDATSGDDLGYGSNSDDQLFADDGDDQLFGYGGKDELFGEDGDDTLDGGDKDDKLYGGDGDDSLIGGDGKDTLEGGAGNDFLDGGNDKDELKGGDGNDTLAGGDGKDTMEGGAGNDFLDGGDDKDELKGGAGDDTLIGGDGKDTLEGGDGNDTLAGGAGDDELKGGAGLDHADYSSASSSVNVDLTDDSKQETGGGGKDTLEEIEGVIGSQYDDSFSFEELEKDQEYWVNGNDGNDTLDLSNFSSNDVTVDTQNGLVIVDFGSNETATIHFENIETIQFSDGQVDTTISANTAPTDVYLSSDSVNENAANGTNVGTVSATDPDDGDTFSFTLTDDADGRFAIDSKTGEITVADGSKLNHEAADSHSIKVEVTDSVGNTYEETVNISVGDVNESPVDVTLSNDSVDENAANGTSVGTVSATDPDDGDTFSFTLTDDADGRFAIDSKTGEITVADGSKLNHEAADSHSIKVEVTDSAGNTYEETVSISVGDVNESSVDVTLSNDSVDENAANGTSVGTVSASDPDDGDTFSFTLTDDADGRFAIDSKTGEITVADGGKLNHEAADGHSIKVEVTDSAGNTYEETVSISVGDVNESPVDVTLSNDSVDENAANGTSVGTVSASDPDDADTFSFTLTDDADGRFAIDSKTGEIIVADGTKLNHEASDSHSIKVEVTDSAGNTYEETVSISVGDVNESPVDVTLSNDSVDENAANGTSVGTVIATDPDDGDTFSFTLTDDADGRFAIDSKTGEITVADGSKLNHEASDGHSIKVEVTDSAGNTYEETVSISVGDVNESPVDVTLSNDSVDENAANGTSVGTVSASDPDDGDTFSYTLTDDADGRFAIDSKSGEITVADGSKLNHEAADSHSIKVEVTDSAGNTYEETVSISVGDVNESPYNLQITVDTVSEGVSAGSVIGKVTVADDDVGDSIEFRLVNDGDGRFTIDPKTGEISTVPGATFSVLDASSHILNVEAVDSSGSRVFAAVKVDIQAANVGLPSDPPEDRPDVPQRQDPEVRDEFDIEDQMRLAELLAADVVEELAVDQVGLKDLVPVDKVADEKLGTPTDWSQVNFADLQPVDQTTGNEEELIDSAKQNERARIEQRDGIGSNEMVATDNVELAEPAATSSAWAWIWGLFRSYAGAKPENEANVRDENKQR